MVSISSFLPRDVKEPKKRGKSKVDSEHDLHRCTQKRWVGRATKWKLQAGQLDGWMDGWWVEMEISQTEPGGYDGEGKWSREYT